MSARSQHQSGLVVIDAVLALVAVVLVVQMWLLSATLEAFLGGHRAAALPAALISIVLCGVCLALAAFVGRIEPR